MEIWKDVKGYEGLYQISNLGSLKSLDRVIKMKDGRTRRLKSKNKANILDNYGYYKNTLYKNSKGKGFNIHRLVAIAFISNPENKPQVNHINGIKTDNRVINLEWATASENTQHAFDNELKETRKGSDCNFSKLTPEEVKEIRLRYKKGGITQKELGNEYNMTRSGISAIIKNKRWQWLN